MAVLMADDCLDADAQAIRQVLVKDHGKFVPGPGRPLISGSAKQAEQSMMNYATLVLQCTAMHVVTVLAQ